MSLKKAIGHQKAGQLSQAESIYRQILKAQPDQAEALHLLGLITHQQGHHDDAIELLTRAVNARPTEPIFYSHLGNAFQAQGQLNDAIACYQQAILIQPNYAEAYNNLGNALQAQGRLDEALASYQQALSIRPDYAEAYTHLGNVLQAQGRLDEAIACQQQAISLRPDFAMAYNNLGNVLQAQGLPDEAAESFRQALLIAPDDAAAYSNRLLTMQYMSTATPLDVFHEHQRYAERFEAPLKQNWLPHQNRRDPERRLKVGYVSGDFCNHTVMFFIEPILASHDKAQVEVYCYYTHTKQDVHTSRIAALADHWLICAEMSDETLAERIRADGIDILIDLSGHTAHNRLPVFARKPAPVQATWMGYAGTTGLTAMDYRITETHLDPPGLTEHYHSEALIRLPENSGPAYEPEADCPPVNPLPALTSDEFVFASLNHLSKITPSVIRLWGNILTTLPHARLMLGNVTENSLKQALIEKFNAVGIVAERLILQPRMSSIDYLALHHHIDMALDPFPYNGGTTTYHSLWMGVPVITLAGSHTVSRCGVAILSRAGLNEFIANNEDEYLQLAVQFAQDLSELSRIRQSLRKQMSTTLCTPDNIIHHLEASYRDMWRKWCSM